MRPLHVRKEIDGFVADRLLEALWREALWLVNDGIATTEEIDDAIRFGAGLRWGFMGTFLIYRLAGGEAGMRHFLAQFGPALKLPWTKLRSARARRGADRPDFGAVRRAGRRASRSASSSASATIASSPCSAPCAPQDFGAGAVVKALRTERLSSASPAVRRAARRRRRSAAPVAGPRAGRLDRLQRPHDRAPLSAVFRRGDRRAAAAHRRRSAPIWPASAASTRSKRT